MPSRFFLLAEHIEQFGQMFSAALSLRHEIDEKVSGPLYLYFIGMAVFQFQQVHVRFPNPSVILFLVEPIADTVGDNQV